MSRGLANKRKEEHRLKFKREGRHLSYFFNGMDRGENPSKLADTLERRSQVGVLAEDLAKLAIGSLPDVRFVEKSGNVDDHSRKIDLRMGIMVGNEEIKVGVQVKSTVGGAVEYLRQKANQFGVGDVTEALLKKNLMVVVVGDAGIPDERRIESVQSQVSDWVARKKNSLGYQ